MDNSDGNDDEGGGGGCNESMWESQQRQLLSIILFTFKKNLKKWRHRIRFVKFASNNSKSTENVNEQINKMAKSIRIISQLLALSNVYFFNLHIAQWRVNSNE